MERIRRMLAALRAARIFGRVRGGGGDTLALGRRGERLAARMLRRQGYQILGRNVRLSIGEADIVCVAPDRETVVVVEVKTRRRGESISPRGNQMAPEASVHARKRRKLAAVARMLARANGWNDRPVRIDVVAIEWPEQGRPTVRHHVGTEGRALV
jgi:putative endonuclease